MKFRLQHPTHLRDRSSVWSKILDNRYGHNRQIGVLELKIRQKQNKYDLFLVKNHTKCT